MQPIALPKPSHTFGPPPGGHLLCAWVRPDQAELLDQMRAKLLCLVRAPACGVIRADPTNALDHLVLIWAATDLGAQLVEQVLARHTLIDWPATIDVTGRWEPWHGTPHEVAP